MYSYISKPGIALNGASLNSLTICFFRKPLMDGEWDNESITYKLYSTDLSILKIMQNVQIILFVLYSLNPQTHTWLEVAIQPLDPLQAGFYDGFNRASSCSLGGPHKPWWIWKGMMSIWTPRAVELCRKWRKCETSADPGCEFGHVCMSTCSSHTWPVGGIPDKNYLTMVRRWTTTNLQLLELLTSRIIINYFLFP